MLRKEGAGVGVHPSSYETENFTTKNNAFIAGLADRVGAVCICATDRTDQWGQCKRDDMRGGVGGVDGGGERGNSTIYLCME